MKQVFNALFVAILLAGCTTEPVSKTSEAENASYRADLKKRLEVPEPPPRFQEQAGQTISIRPLPAAVQAAASRQWLTGITVSLDPAKDTPVSASAIVRMLRSKGLNLTSTMSLDEFRYTGYGVTNVPAETALLIFFGAMGLDYEIDDLRKIITIVPLKPRTWTISVGNRSGTFFIGNGAANTSSSGSFSTGGASGSGMNSAGNASSSQATSITTSSGGTVTATENFWTTLRVELADRLTVLMPKKPAPTAQLAPGTNQPIVPALSSPMGPMGGNTGVTPALGATGTSAVYDMYQPQKIGLYAVNPETGAVTVQAPRYVLDTIGAYLEQVQSMYNTSIMFEGELVSVSSTHAKSEGLDWSSFSQFSAGRATAIIQNSIFGGMVIAPATGGATTPSLTPTNTGIPGGHTMVGAAAANGTIALFNAYLSSIGQIHIHERPVVTTTSGVPVRLEKTILDVYQSYQQTAVAATSTTSGATATNTVDVPYSTGLWLNINPRYDVTTGQVRAQVQIVRTLVSGWKSKINVITSGSNITQLTTQTPVLATTREEGEILLRDGEVIVFGGLTEDDHDDTASGITGLMDTPLAGVTGQQSKNKTTSTYYYALRVTVKKH